VITADLDAALARSLTTLAADGVLPAVASQFTPAGTWRPALGGGSAGYATSVAFEIARLNGRSPAELAAELAESLRGIPWILTAEPSIAGYLTITVTPQALADSAARMAAAGLTCTNSTILRGTAATVRLWPDLTAAQSWQQAWQEQADSMTGRLAQAAGATVTISPDWERGGAGAHAARPDSPVQAAVAYLGVSSVRYRLARTPPGNGARLEQLAQVNVRQADPLYPVQQAHADAASTLRWGADLGIEPGGHEGNLADLLGSPAEQALLGLLSWLQVRVASAARRHRPDDLPRYLEQVVAAWLACRQASPALPFAGQAGPADPAVASARLVLADAVRAVLAAGLALTGISASDRL